MPSDLKKYKPVTKGINPSIYPENTENKPTTANPPP